MVADGIVLMPTLSVETGYESNPDGAFDPPDGTPYGLVDSGIVVGWINSRGATTLGVRGSVLQYTDAIDDDTRWDSGVVLDNAYNLAPGLVASFGTFYTQDEISVVPSKNFGGYTRLDYSSSSLESFLRVGTERTYYYTDFAARLIETSDLTFDRNEEFSFERRDISVGTLYGGNQRVGVYVQGSASRYDYFDQTDEDVLDRDSDEYSVTGGLRIAFAKNLIADAGYRFNWREFESRDISHDSTGYFDGKLTWIPADNIRLILDVDRSYQEPISTFALATVQTNYGVQLQYVPMPLLQVGVVAQHREYEQIGDSESFESSMIATMATYQWTETVELYAAFRYEHLERESDGETSESFRIGAGTKVKLHPGPRAAPVNGKYANFPLPGAIVVTASVGKSYIDFNRWNYSAKTDLLVDYITEHNEEDGQLDGAKYSLEADGLIRHRIWGYDTSVGLQGFFAHYEGGGTSSCTWSDEHDCVFFPLYDPSPVAYNYSGGLFSEWVTKTDQDTLHYGFGVEAKIAHPGLVIVAANGASTGTRPFQFRVGAEFRTIDQEFALEALDHSFFVPSAISLNETLKTDYYGGYVGFDVAKELPYGVIVVLSAEGGLYYSTTDYHGRYDAADSGFGGSGSGPIAQELALSDNGVAFIGGLSVALKKQFGSTEIGLFAETEWYSHVPSIAHNDTDWALFSLVGSNDGTRLADGSAFVYTLGARIGVPLN